MATKDYVKRGRAAKKTANRKAPAPQRGFPLKSTIIAACCVGAFCFGLYYISSAPTPVTPTSSSTDTPVVSEPKKTTPATSTPAKAVTLPPKPEEKWRYIEALENKEVQVEEKKEQAPTRPYLMQCGAYRSKTQADERKAMIAFQGLTSQIKISQGEKGVWYRVILGPYPQKRKAESDRNQLRRVGIEPCAIWYWE
ncbi:SPOR domain-containing protein [Photobacterium japonica]|uniref:SPOR domain-containing protein n=1 Tax=Photobacterium japonica TaxID=2910235 RepID=UPI003D0A24CD